MAGVVAMASVIEDFDTQPCKKSRKDGSSPVVKTITNYFSPVAKAVDKPFSPPRSNNIKDYFSQKTPSSNEKTSPPQQSKENCQISHCAEKHPSPVKQPSQKRGRKATRAARKLVEAEIFSSKEEVSCFIVEEPHESRDAAAEITSSCGILGSDTAALLTQFTADACVTAGASERDAIMTVNVEQAEKDENHEDDSKSGNCVKNEPDLKSLPLSPVVPLSDKTKLIKTAAQNSRKQESKQPEPEENEAEHSLCDVSLEGNVDEASQLNSSTVTISFEDFLRSQDDNEKDIEGQQDKRDESKITKVEEKMDTDQLDNSKAEENMGSGGPSLQVSPRTLTIQAEVHVVPVKQEAVKAVGKLASIFNRRKGANNLAEVVVSPNAEAGSQLSSTTLPVKQKSNVVLQEEDLELAVLESDSTPKCSEVERKQFMAAFKQPSLDGSKTKPGKSQGKQKQSEEKKFDSANDIAEEDAAVPQSVEQAATSSQEKNAPKKKQARKGRKGAKEVKEAVTTSPATVEQAVTTNDDKKEEPHITSTPSISAVRRSRRGAVIRHAPETTATTPTRRTRKQNQSKDTDVATALSDSPVKTSTPTTRKSKHGVFVAEMVCPPDTQESPIRMKFTRVQRNLSTSKAESESGQNPSVATKVSHQSNRRKRAKKLVEKAKVIQQSKKSCGEEKSTLRRSSRNEASIRKSYCEDEDSVICMEEDPDCSPRTAPGKNKTQKPLRSLNDVLGKATPPGKDTKSVPGSKVALLGQGRTARKVSIFDEISHEGSESSQDDELFRARREFLKSGLPESFRKQIAKTAATKEAYSLSCSSFQPVIHMKQPPTDCSLWSLPWPESPLVCHLKELWSQTPTLLPSVDDSFCLETKPVPRAFCERGSGWRPEISESVRQHLMEEIGTSNPHFPVQMFIARFLKRRTDHQQHCTASEPSGVTSPPHPAEPVGGKRKRMDDEGEKPVMVAKKQRANNSQGNVSMGEPEPKTTKRGGRTRRSQRSRLEEEEEKARPSDKTAPIPSQYDSVVIVDDRLLVEDARKKDVVKEDVLWTDKYQPQHSSDIIDNNASVRRLHSWLKEWKLRADREERKKQKEKKQEEGCNDSDWDCGEEESSQDGEDLLCNTVLITGPTGVGKTAAVYACAQELGFKVFEVNASSQRSGRLILSQLKEATQSHQVDIQGVNGHKPTYFNSYGTSTSAGTIRPGSSPRKVHSPRRVVTSPRKHPQSPRGAKKGGLAPTSLANFFKMGRPTNKQLSNTKKSEQTVPTKKVAKENNEGAIQYEDLTVKSPTAATPNEEQNKKNATSLILFEEVDVIFEDDSGFLAAIKTFMTTTKRPVILTTSDPAFSSMFDGNFEEIHFKTPSVLNVASYLQLLCLAENVRTDLTDISSLLRLNGCDIRQSLLQLQFWTRSAGGCRTIQPFTHTGKSAEQKTETKGEAADSFVCAVPSTLPPCDTGCTETKLGLFNVEAERDIWELLRRPVEAVFSLELLTDSRRRGVDLLYSNMEALLPLPLTQLTTSNYKPEPLVSASKDYPSVNPEEPPSSDPLPSHTRLLHTSESADCSDDSSPVKVSNRMKKNKRRHGLPDQHGLHSDSDSEDSFLSLCKGAPQAKVEDKESLVSEMVKRKPLTPEERVKSVPVSQCLESIAEFLDNMSYMDSLLVHPEGGDIHRMSPVGAVVKDGMTDESRLETDRGSWVRGECLLEIQAAVEALSFHKCQSSVADAWDKAQKLEGELGKEAAAELTLPVAAHCGGYSFSQDNPCQPQVVEGRRQVVESLMLRGMVGTGNRSAAALDYLPALRTMCRSEQLKEQGKIKRRFLHYLDAIHLGLGKSTLQQLAEDFP